MKREKLNNTLLALIPTILLLLYIPLNRPFDHPVFYFKSFIDNWIPLLTPFIVFYLSYYLYIIFSFFYLLKLGKTPQIRITAIALILVLIFSYLFYYFFQNAVSRPAITPQNIFDNWYILLNQHLPPYSAFPSLHVSISLILLYGYKITKSKLFSFVIIWTILIIISTVLVKQHYFIDILGGFVFAVASIRLAETFSKKISNL